MITVGLRRRGVAQPAPTLRRRTDPSFPSTLGKARRNVGDHNPVAIGRDLLQPSQLDLIEHGSSLTPGSVGWTPKRVVASKRCQLNRSTQHPY